MRNQLYSAPLWALFSGLLTAFATNYSLFVLGWVCYAPLFIILLNQSPKQALRSGVLFGLAVSLSSFYWMIPGAKRFTDSSMIYGVVVFIVSGIIISLYFGLVSACFARLKQTFSNSTANILLNSLIAASVFTIAEALFMNFSKHLPWFDYHTGNALANNLYAIQPAEYFGMYVISFVVVLINYLIAAFIAQKNWVAISVPLIIIVLYLGLGAWIVPTNPALKASKTSVAIVAQNIAPETVWNNETGNELAGNIISLAKTAATKKPQLALWSESAIPWTYRKDDDLVNEILKTTAPAGTTHILGINTEASKNAVLNSAYCLLPNGAVAGRYDKQHLLALIETPVAGFIFPFLSGGGFIEEAGHYSKPLNTPYGKAGIFICNEATIPDAAYEQVRNGAKFLLNLSNDGWYNNTYITDLHFYNARLRAVETRRDVVINSNTGYSGLILASGEIALKRKGTESFVETVDVTPHNKQTLVVAQPYLFIYLCVGMLVLIVAIGIAKNKKTVDF